jgi:hypothetical protein
VALTDVWQRVGLPFSDGDEADAPRQAATASGNTRVAVFPPAGG